MAVCIGKDRGGLSGVTLSKLWHIVPSESKVWPCRCNAAVTCSVRPSLVTKDGDA